MKRKLQSEDTSDQPTDGHLSQVLRIDRIPPSVSVEDIKCMCSDAGLDNVYVDYMHGMTHGHLLFKHNIHTQKILQKLKSNKSIKFHSVSAEKEKEYLHKSKNQFLRSGVVLRLSGFPARCRVAEIVGLLQQKQLDFAAITYTEGETEAHVRLRQEGSAICACEILTSTEIRVRDFPITASVLTAEAEREFLATSLREAKRKKKRRYEGKQKRSYTGSGTILRLSGFTNNTDTRDILKKLNVFDNMSKDVKVRYLPGDKDAYLQFPNTNHCIEFYGELSEVGGMLEVNSAEITVHSLTPIEEKAHMSSTQVVSRMAPPCTGGCVVCMEGFLPSTTRHHIIQSLEGRSNYSLHYSKGKIKGFLIVKEPTTAKQFVESLGGSVLEVNGKQVQLSIVTSTDEEKEFLLRAKRDREAADKKRREKQ